MCFYCSCLSQSFKFDCRFSGVCPRYSFGEDLYGVNETSLNTRWFNWWPTFIPNRLEALFKPSHFFWKRQPLFFFDASTTRISVTRKDMRDICVLTLWSSVLLGNLPHYYCIAVYFFFWLPSGRILQMFVSWFLGGTRPFFLARVRTNTYIASLPSCCLKRPAPSETRVFLDVAFTLQTNSSSDLLPGNACHSFGTSSSPCSAVKRWSTRAWWKEDARF